MAIGTITRFPKGAGAEQYDAVICSTRCAPSHIYVWAQNTFCISHPDMHI
jgi:hypothetical protein